MFDIFTLHLIYQVLSTFANRKDSTHTFYLSYEIDTLLLRDKIIIGFGHTKRRSSESSLQSLGHGQVAPVCQGGLHQLVLYPQVLKAIVKLSIGHLDGQFLQHIRVLGVKTEPHLTQPVKTLWIVHFVFQ